MVRPVNPPASWWRSGLAVLVVLGMLPVIGNIFRNDSSVSRCDWDGQVVRLEAAVTLELAGRSVTCCDVRCARNWLASHSERPTRIQVQDEHGGGPIDSAEAFYVRSAVVTNRVNGNRWHVFGDRETALRHARESRGRLMRGDEHPFAGVRGLE